MVSPFAFAAACAMALALSEPNGGAVTAGRAATSEQTVGVVIEPNPKRALVALIAPDKPMAVLSHPAAPKAMARILVVDVLETEPGGKLHVSGQAPPDASIWLYLNDSFVASVRANTDGGFAFKIDGVGAAGSYRIRLDEVEPNSGVAQGRIEMPFNVADFVVTASVPAQGKVSKWVGHGANKAAAACGRRADRSARGGSRSRCRR